MLELEVEKKKTKSSSGGVRAKGSGRHSKKGGRKFQQL